MSPAPHKATRRGCETVRTPEPELAEPGIRAALGALATPPGPTLCLQAGSGAPTRPPSSGLQSPQEPACCPPGSQEGRESAQALRAQGPGLQSPLEAGAAAGPAELPGLSPGRPGHVPAAHRASAFPRVKPLGTELVLQLPVSALQQRETQARSCVFLIERLPLSPVACPPRYSWCLF